MASAENHSTHAGPKEDKEQQVQPPNKDNHPYGRWHKYVKPRIGSQFQVKLQKLPPPPSSSSLSVDNVSESDRSTSKGPNVVTKYSTSASSGRRSGRPPKVFGGEFRLYHGSFLLHFALYRFSLPFPLSIVW